MLNTNKYYHSNVNIKEYNFDKVDISNLDYNYIYQLYLKFNKSKNIDEKYNIALQLPNNIFPICRFCGNIIVNLNFLLKISKDKKYIYLIKPKIYCREINGKKYYLSCCEQCLLKHFKNDLPKSSKYYYMKANKYGQYSYGYSDDEFKKICSMTTGVTEKSMINKWGVENGKIKWKEYCNKQAEKNRFEYKQNIFGWTKEQFDDYNKSRAITLKNLINKYGESEGLNKWNQYIYKQHITKSYEYMVNKYGVDKTNEINKSKALTLDNFIKKYGIDEGNKKYSNILNRLPKFYSNISQKCFNEIDKIIGCNYTTYYATKNTEYGINLGDKYVCLDYYIKELKICIEFNGTNFHADKRFYNENDNPNPFCKNITAKQIWELDNDRYTKLLNKGIKTYIIWEYDYIHNKININDFINEIINIK